MVSTLDLLKRFAGHARFARLVRLFVAVKREYEDSREKAKEAHKGKRRGGLADRRPPRAYRAPRCCPRWKGLS